MRRVGITGANGFIGKNLMTRLAERPDAFTAIPIGHDLDGASLVQAVGGCDIIVHLAGVNRPPDEAEFASGNVGFTRALVDSLIASKAVPVIFASSVQAERDTPYGRSKSAAEDLIAQYSETTAVPVRVERLPNVFGKWCRPNYNSVVATFCFNLAHRVPIKVNDPATRLDLLYVDDLIDWIVAAVSDPNRIASMDPPGPVYTAQLGVLARSLESFRDGRSNLMVGPVGTGLTRALHATYLSYLDPAAFDYALTSHSDPRGRFVELLKTSESGQVSYFTANPGVTRGGHYHHSKTEKFLVVSGRAQFRFRHILTNERHEILTDGETPRVVETVPGWAHDITNVGSETLVVMLWANENFDPTRPDTISAPV